MIRTVRMVREIPPAVCSLYRIQGGKAEPKMANTRDYQDVANSIRPVVVRLSSNPEMRNQLPAVEQTAQNIARTFAARNFRFDYVSFYSACGLDNHGFWKGPGE